MFMYLFIFMQLQSACTGKRKMEVDLQQLTQEHEELQNELRGTNDKIKKAVCEVVCSTIWNLNHIGIAL